MTPLLWIPSRRHLALSVIILALLECGVAGAAETPAGPAFRMVEIDAQIGIGYGLAIADVNGDRKPDILLVDKDSVVWYRNPGWEKHVLAGKLTPKDHVCIAAADIDGDGKAEVAVGAEWNPSDTQGSGAVFYMMPPADRRQPWEAVRLPHEPTVHRMRWSRNWQGKAELVVVPLHGRGNNAGTGEGAGVRVLAYERPDNPRDPWPTRVLAESLHKMHNFDLVQRDADEADEFIFAAKEGLHLLNWSQEAGGLRLDLFGRNEIGGAGEIREGRRRGQTWFVAAVEPMHGNTLTVYLPPDGDAAKLPWKRQVVDESLIDGHAIVCADFLGTGADQIVVGWRAMGRPGARVGVKLFAAEDNSGTRWRGTLIDDNGMACEDLATADLDGDGRPDLVAAGRATKNVRIYFNETKPAANRR